MNVQVLLADAAQVDGNGKVHALGLGWTQTSAPTAPMAIIVILEFTHDQAADMHHCDVTLLDDTGAPADIGGGAFSLSADLQPEPVQNLPVDALLSAPFVVNLAPGIPLEPGRRYTWQATVDGETNERWSASFITHAAPDATIAVSVDQPNQGEPR